MKTDNIEKASYSSPELSVVQLDNEISLALQSILENPPAGPGEVYYEYLQEESGNAKGPFE